MSGPQPSPLERLGGGFPPSNDDPLDDGLSGSGGSFRPDATGGSDALAQREAVALDAGQDLKEASRHSRFRDHVNAATIGLFWAVAVSLLVGISTFTWHMVAPESWHYLSNDQLGNLKTVLTTALFSSALTGYVNRRLA